MLKATWVPYDESSRIPTIVQFQQNMKYVKKMSIKQVAYGTMRMDRELTEFEDALELSYVVYLVGYKDDLQKKEVFDIEQKRRKILDENEAA